MPCALFQLAALLHDLDDVKLGGIGSGTPNARAVLAAAGASAAGGEGGAAAGDEGGPGSGGAFGPQPPQGLCS
jgi:hypothetical protein